MALACLVIITILTVAFLQSVRTDLRSSKSYAGGVDARILAETALNIAIGQIQQATQRPDEAWISQPGLIRTYNTRGEPVRAFKLYSSDAMIVEGNFDPIAQHDQEIDPGWGSEPDIYADLNEPIFRGNRGQFPILDPAALGMVEGFKASTSTAQDPLGNAIDTIPMPVKWLYLLSDGTLATAVKAADEAITLTSLATGQAPAEDNPAVARIAFWADDESGKININTAAEGTYAEIPLAATYAKGFKEKMGPPDGYKPDLPSTVYEADLAWYQPAQREYQRYPGHPATTSLSTVLGEPIRAWLMSQGKESNRENILEEIYTFAPRYAGGTGSSFSGTARPPLKSTMAADRKRLYASTDELLFSSDLSNASLERNENDIGLDAGRRQILDRLSFFLTAHSKAPEQTLFNSPRVAIWPVNNDAQKRTTFDKLFAFCSSVLGETGEDQPYFFTRGNPHSPTGDWLLTTDGRPRNQELYQYLQQLTSQPIPGFTTTSLAQKHGVDERDQILTQIFDYIRSTNLLDSSMDNQNTATDESAPFHFTRKTREETGLVVPIEPPTGTPGEGTKGFGRFFTISELTFVSTALQRIPGEPTRYNLQFALVPVLFAPAPGHPQLANRFRIEFTNLSSLRVGSEQVFAEDSHTWNMPRKMNTDTDAATFFGGHMGYRSLINKSTNRQPDQIFPIGTISSVEAGSSTFSGSVTLQLYYDPPDGDAVLVQQGTFEFPSVPFQVPLTTREHDRDQGFLSSAGRDPEDNQFNGRLFPQPFLRNGGGLFDWARSLTALAGIRSDYRLLAATPSTEDLGQKFEKHPWWDTSHHLVHSLRPPTLNFAGFPSGARVGVLAPGLDQLSERPAIVHPGEGVTDPGVQNAFGSMGDWQNVVGVFGDGLSIGRADEGQAPSSAGAIRSSIPYIGHFYVSYGGAATSELGSTYFSPNRLIASPVEFGSLPTGVKRNLPWQTLLFRPARPYFPGGAQHPGAAGVPSAGAPPDHLLLDLFWMPVVEPYAISERFSTAGKINMNYQLAPFTRIERSTGVRAVMKAVMLTALHPWEQASSAGNPQLHRRYKRALYGYSAGNAEARAGAQDIAIRHELDIDATLKYFAERFDANRPFISASEICEIPLVPVTAGVVGGDSVPQIEAKLANFWAERIKLTGDNSLERPYSLLYSRFTSKSNTYQVHVKVQNLSTTRESRQAGVFHPSRDKVSSEFRGSFLIERYLDPNLQTYTPATGLGPYKIRVISSKQL